MKETKPPLLPRIVLAVSIAVAAGAGGEESQTPAGKWQSAPTATYTNPALTGAELYLDIEVAKDGSFRGEWGQYLCNSYAGPYSTFTYSCQRTGSNRVSGRFGPARTGVIDLQSLGSSPFTWAAPGADALTLDLPKNWQGSDAVLYRARLTRGAGKSATPAAPALGETSQLSANQLYREFKQDETAALQRHGGKARVLEGRRGELIELSSGGAAIHIADGFTSRALVLTFPDRTEVNGLAAGAQFRFQCTVTSFDYQYVHLDDCSMAR